MIPQKQPGLSHDNRKTILHKHRITQNTAVQHNPSYIYNYLLLLSKIKSVIIQEYHPHHDNHNFDKNQPCRPLEASHCVAVEGMADRKVSDQ